MSLNSQGSTKKQNRPPSSARATPITSQAKRDCFLFRFKAGSESLDKVIPEIGLSNELEKRSGDAYWQELTSISLTPMAKIGLGQLFTFQFVSPCFEHQKPKQGEKKEKHDSMSFYGQVKFNFR